MNGRGRANSVETVLVTIILIFFTVAIFSLIASGGDVYKKIISDKDGLNQARVAMSYINVKIRQNDTANNISVSTEIIPDSETLVIKHIDGLEGMFTYIFYQDGSLWECFISKDIIPSQDIAMKIVDSGEVYITKSGPKIEIKVDYLNSALSSNLMLRTEQNIEGGIDQ